MFYTYAMNAICTCLLSGCHGSDAPQSTASICRTVEVSPNALRQYVDAAVFYVSSDAVVPRVPPTPPDLLQLAAEQYHQSGDVRAAVAQYFLLYDRELLRRGILDVNSSGSDLVDLLWNMESTKEYRIKESASTSAMRSYMQRNLDYFCLNEKQVEFLNNNIELHRKYILESIHTRD